MLKTKHAIVMGAVILVAAAALAPTRRARPSVPQTPPPPAPRQPSVSAASPEEAGRYIVRTSGCNDCHTPNFMVMGEKVPESQWLIGNPIGFRGPWGTTYPQNLRRFIQPFSDEQFVEVVRKRHDRPPMPWSQLHAMSDQDLKAVYAYLKRLGSTYGLAQPATDWVPPDREPKSPFILMVPQNLPPAASSSGAGASAQGR
jgi:mono/diheme cytochrome c family protein